MTPNLNDLLDADSVFEQFYLSLPEHIRRITAEHSEDIHSTEDFDKFLV